MILQNLLHEIAKKSAWAAATLAKDIYKEIEELPHGRKAVQCKWVLHIKWDKDGQISCFKGRLVVKGFTQIPGQDFTFTFAPIAWWDLICSILCIAALNDLELHHINIKNAYLNAPLDEEIYMIVLLEWVWIGAMEQAAQSTCAVWHVQTQVAPYRLVSFPLSIPWQLYICHISSCSI